MKASELIEKIHNGEIKSGTKIICHKKNEYFDYKITRYFMGNWFSKISPEKHTSNSDFDKDMILSLCDKDVTYEIINKNETQEKISNAREEEYGKLENELSHKQYLYEEKIKENEELKELLNTIFEIWFF